ncbi:MAG: aqualysin 1 [Blastocatellia bacterium]|jgi:subtilisin family serine protease|nr:aqualysin 1 [Blastocatellia bacterium]
MKKLFVLFALILAVATLLTLPFSSRAEKSPEKHEAKFRKAKKPKHDEYIVVLNNETPVSEVEAIANRLAHSHGGSVMGVFRHAIKGFGVRMSEGAAKALANDPRVLLVEENAQSEPTEEPESEVYGYEPYGGSEELAPEGTQFGVSWALDRIDQRNNPYLDGVYRYNRTGQGVDAYIIDSGILLSHNEFGGRAIGGYDWDPNNLTGVDCYGHGTHVAGLLGGRTYGAAKNVRLYAVRIADCNGSSTAYVALSGVDWAISHYDVQVPRRPAVMNISYAFSYYDYYAGSLDYAVNTAIDHGITVVVAAGNFNGFTGGTSPQGSGNAVINVAATDINDVRAQFGNGYASNFGGLVDLFAPGKTIPSAGISSNVAVVNMSGTSMASPLTAGVAAMYLEAFPAALPATVSNAIVNNATPGVVQDADPYGGAYTVNLLLYDLFIPPPPHIIFFSSANYAVNESGSSISITVNRSGNDLPPVTVDYTATDGSATQKADYTLALGTLSFGAGETSKTFPVFITDDGYVEGNETVNLTLSNPTGGASLGVPNKAVLTITSNDSTTSQPIDGAQFFVKEQYRDFLNRDPDQGGWDFWTNQITSCGGDAQCIEIKRINVSAAFFLSIEFQQTGYLSYRFYNAALNRPNGLPRYLELMRDTQAVGRGVVVGASGWEAQLEANKVAYANSFVSRSEFTTLYSTSLTPAQFVDALYAHAGITPSSSERQAAIDEFNNPTGARGRVLRRVADNQTFYDRETNRAFVLMEYFGYLRRNPDDPPDNNLGGYNFWLDKLNQFNGNFVDAEMVKAFITSAEYRQRFGP